MSILSFLLSFKIFVISFSSFPSLTQIFNSQRFPSNGNKGVYYDNNNKCIRPLSWNRHLQIPKVLVIKQTPIPRIKNSNEINAEQNCKCDCEPPVCPNRLSKRFPNIVNQSCYQILEDTKEI